MLEGEPGFSLSPKSGYFVPHQPLTAAAGGIFAAPFVLVELAPFPWCCRYFAGDFTDSSLHTSLSQPRKSHAITILLVLLNGKGFGSLANVAELYVSHPPALPGVTEVSPYHGAIFRRSPGSAAVTTPGRYCNAAYGQGIEQEVGKLALS